MVVLVIIGQDGHVGISRIVQSLAQQGTVMSQPAVSDVFCHADSSLFVVIFSALQGSQRLPDHDLGRKTDVVVHVLFSQADGFLPADRQGLGPNPLCCQGRGHDPAEGVRSVGHQNHLFFSALLCKFHRVGIRQAPRRLFFLPPAPHGYGLHKGIYPDPQSSLDIALIEL